MSGGGSSGGGASGKVSYPGYLEDAHEDAIHDMTDDINDIRHTSPYASAYAYNPSDDIDDMRAALDRLSQYKDTLDAQSAWAEAFDLAINTINNSGPLSSENLAEMTSAYQEDQSLKYVEAKRNFISAMNHANATMTSSFVIGLALLESQKQRDIGHFRTQALLQKHRERLAFVLQATNDMYRQFALGIELEKILAQLSIDVSKMNVVAQRERFDTDLTIDVKDTLWKLELYRYLGNLMAAIGSGVSAPGTEVKESKGASVLGGAVSGAAMGAPGGAPGMLAGAVIGGIGGLFTG